MKIPPGGMSRIHDLERECVYKTDGIFNYMHIQIQYNFDIICNNLFSP